MTTLKTSLGEFHGKAGNGVIQYLGIKYASLKDQLSVPELMKSYKTEIIDATSFGPRAPAMDGCAFEQTVLIQQAIDVHPSPPMSGIECLNLNITVPSLPHGSAEHKNMPVMVFIHGGGFIMGSNYWSHYDPARLVKMSVEQGLPVIVVNINYRLRVLGNLTSSELRKAGYPGNNSLRDQKCALQWIRTNIGEFGGDAQNVTAFGVSAGAASVLYHHFSKEALFKRAISMSGTPIMLKPLPSPATEMAYGMVMKALSLENASVEERIKRLNAITPEELVEKIPMSVPLLPFLDGDIVPAETTFKSLADPGKILDKQVPGRTWCEQLMIGDCRHDGTVYFFMGLSDRKNGIATALQASLSAILGAQSTRAILSAYDIQPSATDDEALKQILGLANDIAYYVPASSFASSFPGKAYYYHFNELNLWDGAFKGYSTHLLDTAYLFQNFEEKFASERERGVGRDMARAFIRFAHGEEPWKQFEGINENVKTFGEENFGRRKALFKLKESGKIDLDKLSLAWDMFVAGK